MSHEEEKLWLTIICAAVGHFHSLQDARRQAPLLLLVQLALPSGPCQQDMSGQTPADSHTLYLLWIRLLRSFD